MSRRPDFIGFKTLVSLVVLAVIATGGVLASHPASADAPVTPPDSCFAFSAGTITVYYSNEGNNTANPACPKAIAIPATIGGVAVTSIGSYAFYNNQLTSVTIPSSVTSIGSSAFYNNQLTSVTIPSSVTSIGSGAFYNNQLTSVTIPSSVTSIGNSAFSGNQLTSVTIQGDPATIGTGVFANDPISSLTYNGVTYTSTDPIAESCFVFDAGSGMIQGFHYADLQIVKSGGPACLNHDLVVPATIGGTAVTSIGNYAFINSQLTSVTIPSSVTTAGMSVLYGNPIVSITYNGITERARFAQLSAALHNYENAFKLYKAEHGEYPHTPGYASSCLGSVSDYPAATGFQAGQCGFPDENANIGADDLNTALKPYLNKAPIIPPLSTTYADGTTSRGIYYEGNEQYYYFEYGLSKGQTCPYGKDSWNGYNGGELCTVYQYDG